MKHKFKIDSDLRQLIMWLALSLALWGGDRLGWYGFIRRGFEQVVVPLEIGADRLLAAARRPWEAARFSLSGTERIADLERQVAQLTVDSRRVAEVEAENRELRKLIQAAPPAEWSFVPALLLGRGEAVSVGAGRDQGIEVGEAVISEMNLIGVISEVGPRQSKVKLLSEPSLKVAARVQRTEASGVITGKFGSQIILDQILQDKEISPGDEVSTTGEFGAPRGLLVGKVSGILSDNTEIFKQAAVEPLVRPEAGLTVFIVKEGK